MVLDALRSYVQLASGLTDVTRERALAAARLLIAQSEAGVGAVLPATLKAQVGSLTDDLIATSKGNRMLMLNLVRLEVERSVARLGLVSAAELDSATQRAARLEARVADLEQKLRASRSLSTTKTAATKAAPRKSAAKKTAAKKATAKKASAKKATAKKATSTRTAAKRTAANSAPAEAGEPSAPQSAASNDHGSTADVGGASVEPPSPVPASVEPPSPVPASVEPESQVPASVEPPSPVPASVEPESPVRPSAGPASADQTTETT